MGAKTRAFAIFPTPLISHYPLHLRYNFCLLPEIIIHSLSLVDFSSVRPLLDAGKVPQNELAISNILFLSSKRLSASVFRVKVKILTDSLVGYLKIFL
jgi:hypothetical protein